MDVATRLWVARHVPGVRGTFGETEAPTLGVILDNTALCSPCRGVPAA